jgi:hypothetical protein
VFDSQSHLHSTSLGVDTADTSRQPRYDYFLDHGLTGDSCFGVVIVDCDEQRPSTLVHDLVVPFDVLWSAHRWTERYEFAIVLVCAAVCVVERNEGARSWRSVTAPALVENGLGLTSGCVEIVWRSEGFGEEIVETGSR